MKFKTIILCLTLLIMSCKQPTKGDIMSEIKNSDYIVIMDYDTIEYEFDKDTDGFKQIQNFFLESQNYLLKYEKDFKNSKGYFKIYFYQNKKVKTEIELCNCEVGPILVFGNSRFNMDKNIYNIFEEIGVKYY